MKATELIRKLADAIETSNGDIIIDEKFDDSDVSITIYLPKL